MGFTTNASRWSADTEVCHTVAVAVEEGAVTLSEMQSEGLTVNRSLFLLLLLSVLTLRVKCMAK